MRCVLLASFCFALVSCTATCLRDSDCMGASICADNRCLLISGSRRDGGRTPTSTDTDNPGFGPDAGTGLELDAGVN